MLLDFDEHMFHRRIMQEAFTRSRLAGYVEHIDRVASRCWPTTGWPTTRGSCSIRPLKELTLDIASVVFMGHEPGTDRELVTTVNHAFTTTTRAGNAIVRKPVPPLTWWRGIKAREDAGELLQGAGRREARGTRHRHVQRAVPRPRTRTASGSPTRTS